ncbi:MSMEG_1061 family FMN-dependent PPOX-type flavoprotein [Chelatococcus reniformis]|uniref:Flavin-nucleotide-binding protein n=1 Tax=Chelatococcus reniformis TaxID=1494448 RepID=A0A916XI15_9HYPH|nr:MSMEG_1061 family FMN-dependent PPOX-type flavoprotein [Chelatococcus reniformis]GGC73521.1 flavin-nucleotide-binding protein [Chelatococcus reniformis]
MATITTIEALRQIIPATGRTTKIRDHIDEQGRDFIAASPFLIMATTSASGIVEVSPKGDAPGFVEMQDDRTLLVPDRVGNNLAFGLENLIANPAIALIFIVPNTGETLRVTGRGEIIDDADVCERMSARGKAAKLVTRIHVERAYFHCARSLLRASLWDPATWPPPGKISFGRIIAEATADARTDVATFDRNIDEAYKYL